MTEKERMVQYIKELKNNARVFIPISESVKFVMYVLILEGRKFYNRIKSESCRTKDQEFKCYYYES